jgi:hypothetical protein
MAKKTRVANAGRSFNRNKTKAKAKAKSGAAATKRGASATVRHGIYGTTTVKAKGTGARRVKNGVKTSAIISANRFTKGGVTGLSGKKIARATQTGANKAVAKGYATRVSSKTARPRKKRK